MCDTCVVCRDSFETGFETHLYQVYDASREKARLTLGGAIWGRRPASVSSFEPKRQREAPRAGSPRLAHAISLR